MRSYTISPVCKDIDWNTIPSLPIDIPLWGTETDIRAQARVCYDKDALHIKMEAVETHIRAEEEGPLASPCRDSCLEFSSPPWTVTAAISTLNSPPPAVCIWALAAASSAFSG